MGLYGILLVYRVLLRGDSTMEPTNSRDSLDVTSVNTDHNMGANTATGQGRDAADVEVDVVARAQLSRQRVRARPGLAHQRFPTSNTSVR